MITMIVTARTVVVLVATDEPQGDEDKSSDQNKEHFKVCVAHSLELLHDDLAAGHVDKCAARGRVEKDFQQLVGSGHEQADNDADGSNYRENKKQNDNHLGA